MLNEKLRITILCVIEVNYTRSKLKLKYPSNYEKNKIFPKNGMSHVYMNFTGYAYSASTSSLGILYKSDFKDIFCKFGKDN